jgi:glycine hydroxymethyltransferase
VAQEVLDRAGITLNRNTIPDDPRSAFVTSGLRLGSAAETTAGMNAEEMKQVAGLISRALRHRDDEKALGKVREEIRELCGRFPPYPQLSRRSGGG